MQSIFGNDRFDGRDLPDLISLRRFCVGDTCSATAATCIETVVNDFIAAFWRNSFGFDPFDFYAQLLLQRAISKLKSGRRRLC